ncbi:MULTISPECIES: DUF1294 domain-containing protein [Sutcliffiella]|uniref:DUF1294 domain-containing protein n=1 Tax=Sutcliffiella cohnii TaxID=33932 RepID=A0A223KTJ0_9BACI|nr:MULTISPECIES: DUF1294 domain-containing protein [Sutcliffiella]AST92811.1 hypothetical protein BC6307_16710 [Sutcliffiella cohnii]MED4016242.1 DUF1294 domain-containing protein [Sutcliffiella cohnii]WBL14066.1 DUF1294 domain-containing protein [Sutcliffiella sp. NC1]
MIELLLIYLVLNSVAFLLMKVDKKRAINNKWRISESTLWAISIVGGALGSWAGMKKFRHKTKHNTFKFGMPLLTLVQIGTIIYFTLV